MALLEPCEDFALLRTAAGLPDPERVFVDRIAGVERRSVRTRWFGVMLAPDRGGFRLVYVPRLVGFHAVEVFGLDPVRSTTVARVFVLDSAWPYCL